MLPANVRICRIVRAWSGEILPHGRAASRLLASCDICDFDRFVMPMVEHAPLSAGMRPASSSLTWLGPPGNRLRAPASRQFVGGPGEAHLAAEAHSGRCADRLSGCAGLGDLGDHSGLRADIYLYSQSQPSGQGEQGVHGGVVLGGL